jgi:pilus assembly protein CpaC
MRIPVLTTLAIGLALAPAMAMAQYRAPHAKPWHKAVSHRAVSPAATRVAAASASTSLLVDAGSGRVLALPAPVSNVFVSDPKIVEVRPASPTSLFLFGVAPGRTTVAALDAAGHPIRQFEVTVRPSRYGATQAAGVIARTAPGSAVRLDAQPKHLVLNGTVANAAQAQQATTTASAFLGDGQTVDNQLHVRQDIQVGLHVRIAEMSRSVTRNLGINWQALGQIGQIGALTAFAGASGLNTGAAATIVCAASGLISGTGCKGASVSAVIDALAADNLVHVLAEPNLTAMSGETASFLVGGEFPIPIAQGGTSNAISIEFKQYGIALSFVPTVMSDNRIRIHVSPEVSQLTTVGSVTLNGITIPALTVRRADTTVELGSGQSFAIAGLLSDSSTQAGNAIPDIGEVPILGALFHSDAFQRQQTELVIIVTPYIVRPVSDPAALRLPTDGFKVPNDIERLLLMRQVGRGGGDQAQRVPGQAGFVVE